VKKSILVYALFLLVIIFEFGTVDVVSADPPSVETIVNTFSYSFPCDDFDVQAAGTEKIKTTTFFDMDGSPTRIQTRIFYDGTVTNLDTDQTLRDTSNFMFIFDLENGTTTEVGVSFHITVPGRGVAVLNVGNLILDSDGNVIFVAGKYQPFDESVQLVCQALS